MQLLKVSVEFCNGGRARKTRSIPLRDCQKVWRGPFVYRQYNGIGQTDGRTDIQNNIVLCVHRQADLDNETAIVATFCDVSTLLRLLMMWWWWWWWWWWWCWDYYKLQRRTEMSQLGADQLHASRRCINPFFTSLYFFYYLECMGSESATEWMNEWMKGWMDGWMHAWMDGWVGGLVVDGRMNE